MDTISKRLDVNELTEIDSVRVPRVQLITGYYWTILDFGTKNLARTISNQSIWVHDRHMTLSSKEDLNRV